MQSKLTFLLFVLLFTFSASFSFAQEVLNNEGELLKTEGTTKYYHIENTEQGVPEFVQTLSWFNQEDVLYYDVYIEEKNESGLFSEILKLEKVESNSVDVRLKPGFYRYYVIAYNLLEEPEIRSETLNFEIQLAIQPELESISPKVIYLEEIYNDYFSLVGKNFLPTSKFDLRLYNESETSYSTLNAFKKEPSLNANGTKAEIKYDKNKLNPGTYKFTVENPGGLSSSQELLIRYQKPMDLDISVGYHPAWIVRDSTIPDYFETNQITMGIGAKLTWIPFKTRTGFYGIGINPCYYQLTKAFDAYTISATILTGQLNLVYQYPLIRNHLYFEFHAGAGVLHIQDLHFEFERSSNVEAISTTYYAADAGLAFQIYVHKHTYIELQAEYTASMDNVSAIDLVSPSLSIGHQF